MTRLRQQQEDSHFRILQLLEENPNMSQREMAKALGLSLGGLNYCLQALLTRGWIKIQNFHANPRKLTYAYLLTPSGFAHKASLTATFLKRKLEEYERLKIEIATLQQAMNGQQAMNSLETPPVHAPSPLNSDSLTHK